MSEFESSELRYGLYISSFGWRQFTGYTYIHGEVDWDRRLREKKNKLRL